MKTLALLLALMLAVPAVVSAEGINLAWDNCVGAGGAQSMNFACDTNAGAHTFVASFIAPAGITQYVSNQSTIVVTSDGATLPQWWQIRGTGQCRIGSATGSADFTPGPFGCTDLWLGAAMGALASYNVGFGSPNVGRMNLVFAVTASHAQPLNEGEEYYAFKVLILNTKTVGTGACAGCSVGARITCNELQVQQPSGTPGGNVILHNPADGYTSNCCTWNNPTSPCVLGVATRNTTWGSIKSLYR
jgi:hypothetical protein